MQTLLLSWYFLRFISYGYCFFHYGSAFSALILLASRFHFWHRNKYHVGEITVPAVIRRLTPPSQLAIQLSNKMLKTPLYHAVLLSARTSAVLCFLVDWPTVVRHAILYAADNSTRSPSCLVDRSCRRKSKNTPKFLEHCNTAWLLLIKAINPLDADRPLQSALRLGRLSLSHRLQRPIPLLKFKQVPRFTSKMFVNSGDVHRTLSWRQRGFLQFVGLCVITHVCMKCNLQKILTKLCNNWTTLTVIWVSACQCLQCLPMGKTGSPSTIQ